MTKKKNRKKEEKATKNQDSCLMDGCYYLSWVDFSDGCIDSDFDGGCLDFDLSGCLDISDGCTMLTLFPLRLVVIIGLMLYGDWDFKHHRAKSHHLLD